MNTNNPPTLEILSEEVCTDDGYQVDYDVRVTNANAETKDFHIVFQTLERLDKIKAYNDYEMEVCSCCDSNETSELMEFLDYEDYEKHINQLYDCAEKLSKEWFEANTECN